MKSPNGKLSKEESKFLESVEEMAPAIEVNRRTFIERLEFYDAKSLVKSIRHTLGIPPNGFVNRIEASQWENGRNLFTDQLRADQATRISTFALEARRLRNAMGLHEVFQSAVRHYILTNQIGHIQGNTSIKYSFGSRKIEMIEDVDLHTRTEEKNWLRRSRDFIRSLIPNKSVENRNTTVKQRSLDVFKASQKISPDEPARNAKLMDKVWPDLSEEDDISRSADNKRKDVVRKDLERFKKRNQT